MQKIKEIDYLRGFAILGVIAIHTTGYFTEIPKINSLLIGNLYIDMFSHFAVPMFVFISGFVLYARYNSKFSVVKFYSKRIKSIIPQYVIFTYAYMIFYDYMTNKHTFTLAGFKHNLLYASGAYHLWYFAIIIQLYILFPLIITIYNGFEKYEKGSLFLTICLIGQVTWNIYKIYVTSIQNSNALIEIIKHYPIFLSHVLYFALGMYISKRYDYISAIISKFKLDFIFIMSLLINGAYCVVILIALRGGIYFYNIPYYYYISLSSIEPVLYMSIFTLLLVLSIKLHNGVSITKRIIKTFGEYSFGIYLIHIFFNVLIIRAMSNQGITYMNGRYYPILFIGTAVISLCLTMIISFLPFSQYIIGINREIKYFSER